MNVNTFNNKGPDRPSVQNNTAYSQVPVNESTEVAASDKEEVSSREHSNSPTPRIQVFASKKHKPPVSSSPFSLRNLCNCNYMAVQIKPSPVGLCIICLSMVIILYYMFRYECYVAQVDKFCFAPIIIAIN